MIRKLIEDESGMTMGLAVMMVVLIGVMGAGLLTFVQRDLETVIEVNRGQAALEAADAGVQAAKQQLISDVDARDHFDGGADDLPWSYCYNITDCTSATPTATGSAGMRVNLDDGNYTDVTILTADYSAEIYKVISEGRSGDARRKVEAILRVEPSLTAPPVYFSRSDITLTGSASVDGISFFAMSDIDFPSGEFDLGTSADMTFGSWAETSGDGPYPNAAGSYPNTYNAQARPSNLVGVGAQGFITGQHAANALEGTRSFDSDSIPYNVVPDYDASALSPGTKIAFPFQVPSEGDDKEEIDFLRQRALYLEQQTGTAHYIDSNPGNGVDDAGMVTRPSFDPPLEITSWPAGSDYATVMFYEFATYNANNRVSYKTGSTSDSVTGECGAQTHKGVIMVQNGDAVYEGSRRFDGGIFVRAYDPDDQSLLHDVGGLFNGAGQPCLYGYVNTSGDQTVTGSIRAGTTPELGRVLAFRGAIETVSWRELYQ